MNSIRACLPCFATPSSPDHEEQQAQQAGRRPFARDELEGLLTSYSSDDDAADTLSLHSNVGGTLQSNSKRKGRRRGQAAWGVPGRKETNGGGGKVMQILGWYPFGRPGATVGQEEGEETTPTAGPSDRGRAGSMLSTEVPDAAPLDSSTIAQLGFAEQQERELARRKFEPASTNDELEREERELAEREEREASPHTTRSSFQPAPTPAPEAKAPSRADEHAKRLRRAARDHKRRLKEEGKRQAQEELERRAEAAAGFGEDDGDFGDFVTFRPDPALSATTEDTLSEITSSQPTPPVTHAEDDDEEDDEDLMDYGAEYAKTRMTGSNNQKTSSQQGSSDKARSIANAGALERLSAGSGSSSRRVAGLPRPPSSVGSGSSARGFSPSRRQARIPTHQQSLSREYHQSRHNPLAGTTPQVHHFDGKLGEYRLNSPVMRSPLDDDDFDGVPGGL